MSSRITAADFPPSSSVQRAIRSPHNDAMRRPAAVEPVNVILSTPGFVHEQLRHLTVGGHDVEHAGRQADLLRDLREHVALARRLGRRLEHDRAAGEERGADLVADERDRRVPRDDRADDADRLAHEQAELAAAGRRALLLERERVGQRGVRARARPIRSSRRTARSCRARPTRAATAAPSTSLCSCEPGAERADVLGALARGSGAATGPRRTPAAPPRPPEPCRRARPPRPCSTRSSFLESITSIVASDEGSTHSPPMKNRSACDTGAVVASCAVLMSSPS